MSTSVPPHPAPPAHVDHRVLDLGRLLVGGIIVALGILFLLDSAGTLNADRAIDRWWPIVLVAAGTLTLAEKPPARVRGTIFLGAGVILLLFTTDVLHDNAWDYIWPALIVVAGLAIVFRWHGRTISGAANTDDVIRSTAVFGGQKQSSASPHFHGAWLTAVFGGVTLDLRNAHPAPEGASINATVAFGGIDVLVPKGWRISIRSTPIFGGTEDKTDHTEPLPDDAPILHVDGVALFGGIDVKHGK